MLQNFKTWDNFDSGTATSYKTIDLDFPSFKKPNAIWNSGRKAVDAAIDFEGYTIQGVRIDSSMVTTREVRIAIPRDATGVQLEQLNRVIKYGADNHVNVKVEKY